MANPRKTVRPRKNPSRNGEGDYAQHGGGEPAFEHFTCATGHLLAERTLRIIEQGTQFGAGPLPDFDTIEMLRSLVDRAGPHFARIALNEQSVDDIPF